MKQLQDFVHTPPPGPFYAVIGHPVAHSKSPLIHNIALQHHRIPAVYYAVDTPSDAFAWIGKLFGLQGFRGLNVTIPHKSRIMEPLDLIDPVALEVGAVNTVHLHRNGLIGYNTDVTGFEESLREHALLLTGGRAVILGSGGAARAAAASLKTFGMHEALVFSRNPASAGWPESLNGVPVRMMAYEQLQSALSESALIINTTPLGMHPYTKASPVSEPQIPFLKDKVCMDAIYNPQETAFMKQARSAGARAVIGGLTMFIAQAAASFRIWTGKTFPGEKAARAMMEELGNV